MVEGTWTDVTPAGFQESASLAVSPAFVTDHTLFAGDVTNDVFRSTDGGAHWTALPVPSLTGGIDRLAVSPDYAHDHTLFVAPHACDSVAVTCSLYRSSDGGLTWEALDTGRLGSVNAVAVAPDYASSRTLFIGTAAGVLRSRDGGSTWAALDLGLTEGVQDVERLALSPTFRRGRHPVRRPERRLRERRTEHVRRHDDPFDGRG